MGEDGHPAAERRDEAGRQQLLERVGCPAQARPDEQRAAEEQGQPETDAQDCPGR